MQEIKYWLVHFLITYESESFNDMLAYAGTKEEVLEKTKEAYPNANDYLVVDLREFKTKRAYEEFISCSTTGC